MTVNVILMVIGVCILCVISFNLGKYHGDKEAVETIIRIIEEENERIDSLTRKGDNVL